MAHLWNPEVYQGAHRRRNYFEGWYYKLISADRTRVLALIPGIALGREAAEAHAFIQAIDARRGLVAYLRYPAEAFRASSGRFDVRIGGSRFSGEGVELRHDAGEHQLLGGIRFSDIEPYPKRGLHRGIMGPFTFLPGMECRHGVVNIRQRLHGRIVFDGVGMDFEGGEGYVEKDWGRSFPSAWIWLQAGHFEDPRASFLFSAARVPWLGRSFTGLISFLRAPDGVHRLATYNRAKIERLAIGRDRVDARILRPGLALELSARFAPGGVLRAPKDGRMERTIEETLSAEVEVRLTARDGRTLFRGTSGFAGMEISEGAERLAVPPPADQ
ncbi:MAG: hypothetical protein KBA30_02430 [Clostridia bacterium]|nr:hypothetical protein [Clostridia bacterium]